MSKKASKNITITPEDKEAKIDSSEWPLLLKVYHPYLIAHRTLINY